MTHRAEGPKYGFNQDSLSREIRFPNMRRMLLALFIVTLLSPVVSAETYRISGKATYADSSPVTLDYVSIACSQGEFGCYQYRGTNALTNAYGDFTIVIEAEEEEDNLEILLTLKGENFTHIIDLSRYENSSQGRVYQDIVLAQNPPLLECSLALDASLSSSVWSLFRCCCELVDACQLVKGAWNSWGIERQECYNAQPVMNTLLSTSWSSTSLSNTIWIRLMPATSQDE